MRRFVSLIVYWILLAWHGRAPDLISSYRVRKCRGCEELQWRTYEGKRVIGWCGGPMARREGVCGCPVAQVPLNRVTGVLMEPTVEKRKIKAKALAVAFRKTTLNGQKCPQNRW